MSSQLKTPAYSDQYPEMEGGPFADEFNNRSRQHWLITGRAIKIDVLMVEILIDDYDERHKQENNPDDLTR